MTTVILTTNKGNITLTLDEKAAPITTQNFINYINSGHYDGTIFHRVIGGFMIQGGGLDRDMVNKPTNKPIQNEASNGLKHAVGVIAMARTNDPHSATSQFFIDVAPNDFLNFTSETPRGWGYCVFGKVADEASMNVVMAISHVNTINKNGYQDVPEEAIVIEKVEVVSELERNLTNEMAIK
jgi:peptidyl-prolyl cis-trans isomerase B (cyclophilin B)